MSRVKKAFEATAKPHHLKFIDYRYDGSSFGSAIVIVALKGVWVRFIHDGRESACTTELSIPLPRRQWLDLAQFLEETLGMPRSIEDECPPEEGVRIVMENYEKIAKALSDIKTKAQRELLRPGKEYNGRASERHDFAQRALEEFRRSD